MNSFPTSALLYFLALLLLGIAGNSQAAEEGPRPAFMQTDVLKAALAMQLTEDQQPQFREALSELVNGQTKAYNSLARKSNQTDLPRKMRSKTNRLFKQFNKQMTAILTPEQLPAFQTYRDLLKSKML